MKFKKLLLSLGTVAAVVAPVAAVVACGVDDSKVKYVFNQDDKTLTAAVKANKGVLPENSIIKAQPYTVFADASITDADAQKVAANKFVVFEITQTIAVDNTGAKPVTAAGVNTFSKGTPVNLIKSVVQYMKKLDADHAKTFSIEIAARKVTETKDYVIYTPATGDKTVGSEVQDSAKNVVAVIESGKKYAVDADGKKLTKVTSAVDPADYRATLNIALKSSFEIENITEQLINVKASGGSTPHDSITAPKFTVA